MSERVQTYLDEEAGVELRLPVTPKEYQCETGINVNLVNIDGLGDLHMAGYRTLDTEVVEGFFPAHNYPFSAPGASADPWTYIRQLERWCRDRKVLRYLVAGTEINMAVILESVRYYERDGTNDLYFRITHREYEAPQVLPAEGAPTPQRPAETAAATPTPYTVVKGDTLWCLCRKFYGETSMALCQQVAAANGIKNPNLIRVGQSIRFPAKKDL